jgi:SAM-dependent methyltransferase
VTGSDWNQHYLEGSPPWDTDTPSPELVEFVRDSELASGRALDIGCGTGLHARWLAAHGFDVVGIDISPAAIERARAATGDASSTVRFVVLDFLTSLPEGGPFDLVVDRGVFHVFDAAEDRAQFASQVARCLAPSGHWLSLIGSTEGPPREEGPPRRSARDITAAIEPVLEIVELRTTHFDLDRPVQPRAWCCVARPREVTGPLIAG